MKFQKFIYSNNTSYRITRHLVFWIIYCIYFYLQSLPPRIFSDFFLNKTYFIALMNVCAFAPVFITITYFFIYYLLPKTIERKKYLLFSIGFLLTYIIGTAINYFTAEWFLVVTQFFPDTFQHKIEMSNYNTRWGILIATIALGIKLTKNWYLQQKENLEIIKRKSRTEMQFEKARIHPELLLRSLETIYTNIQFGYDKAPVLILNLSELLSYSLYENENTLVHLKDELTQLQHLIALEQQKEESFIDIDMQVTGNTNRYIAPMILVKMLEQIISNLYNAGVSSCLLQLNLFTADDMLFSTFALSDINENALQNISWSSFLTNAQNRLNSYYNLSHFNIELNIHDNKVIISLELKLSQHAREIGSLLNTAVTY